MKWKINLILFLILVIFVQLISTINPINNQKDNIEKSKVELLVREINYKKNIIQQLITSQMNDRSKVLNVINNPYNEFNLNNDELYMKTIPNPISTNIKNITDSYDKQKDIDEILNKYNKTFIVFNEKIDKMSEVIKNQTNIFINYLKPLFNNIIEVNKYTYESVKQFKENFKTLNLRQNNIENEEKNEKKKEEKKQKIYNSSIDPTKIGKTKTKRNEIEDLERFIEP